MMLLVFRERKEPNDKGEERKENQKNILRQMRYFFCHNEKNIDFISCLISINFEYSLLSLRYFFYGMRFFLGQKNFKGSTKND